MGLNLERVLYTSRARGNADNLMMQVEILAVSQRNNARDGLTGALMIHTAASCRCWRARRRIWTG